MMRWRIVRPYTDPQMQRVLEWVRDMMNGSVATAEKIGCTPAAIVAQAALETGWGKAAIGNNVFGIKADSSWKGAKVLRRTAEQRPDGSVYWVNDWFRDYPTLADGIADHFRFLSENGRYAKVFDPHGVMSDHEYFRQLQLAGYATDIRYADKLAAVEDAVHGYCARMQYGDGVDAPRVWRLLQIGDIGADVEKVQGALLAKGFDPKGVDGDFGPATYGAVLAFQEANPPLSVDGIVGDKTLTELGLIP